MHMNTYLFVFTFPRAYFVETFWNTLYSVICIISFNKT